MKCTQKIVKIVSLLVVVFMAFVCASACTSGKPSGTSNPTAKPTAAPTEAASTPEVTEEPTEVPTEAPVDAEALLVGTWEIEVKVMDHVDPMEGDPSDGSVDDLDAGSDASDGEDDPDADVESTEEPDDGQNDTETIGDPNILEALEDLSFKLVLTLNADGSYSCQPDEESFNAAMDAYADAMVEFTKSMLMGMINGSIIVDDDPSADGDPGTAVTEEDLLAMLEVESWDELKAQILNDVHNGEDGEDGAFVPQVGMYKYADGKLYLSGEEGVEADDTCAYLDIEVTAETLIVNTMSTEGLLGLDSALLPATFIRVND